MTKYTEPKEIARAAEVTPRTVLNNEARWGLVRLPAFRQVRYDRPKAARQLLKHGIILD